MIQTFTHSADVDMWLDCGEHGLMALTRITPKSVVAQAARSIPPCLADLVVTVDGKIMRQRVNLIRGFSNGRLAALIRPINDVPF